jgi:hypothetical protein
MLSNVLFILLGAGLVSIGFLAAALAERLRGPRVMLATTPRVTHATTPRVIHDMEPRGTHVMDPHATLNRVQKATLIPLVEGTELLRPTSATRPPRGPRTEPKVTSTGGDDVIAALVAAGYKKPIATEATWACGVAERATIEGWAASALRRCGRGGAS